MSKGDGDGEIDEDRTVIRSSGLTRTQSQNALPNGKRLAEFEILGVVGEGGFGIVYLAQDHSLHRRVAIKEYMPAAMASRADDATSVMLRSRQHEETFALGLRSFVNEARLLAQFDHPALLKVYRFWEANSTAYMAMPYYEGRTLRETLAERHADARRPTPPPDEAWLRQTLSPVMDALALMHASRCFHRDVAPDNIMLLRDGRPVLLDLGAARRVIGDKTQALTVILKAGYAPVEQYAQAPGVEQGPWTDIYALGAVMHHALTTQVPPNAVTRVLHDSYEPLEHVVAARFPGRYDARFLRAVDACLRVRGHERPQSMAQLRELLGWHEAALPAPPRRPSVHDDESTVILPAAAVVVAQASAVRSHAPVRGPGAIWIAVAALVGAAGLGIYAAMPEPLVSLRAPADLPKTEDSSQGGRAQGQAAPESSPLSPATVQALRWWNPPLRSRQSCGC